jgi:hypothetical protein
MKVRELIDQLANTDPESEVVVKLWGGLRGNCTIVTRATIGFDWFHGKTVLDTERAVTWFEKRGRIV